MKEIMVEIVN